MSQRGRCGNGLPSETPCRCLLVAPRRSGRRRRRRRKRRRRGQQQQQHHPTAPNIVLQQPPAPNARWAVAGPSTSARRGQLLGFEPPPRVVFSFSGPPPDGVARPPRPFRSRVRVSACPHAAFQQLRGAGFEPRARRTERQRG